MLTVPTGTRPKTDLVQDLLEAEQAKGQHLSVSQARRLALRVRRGDFNKDPELARVISYADPTGERAVGNVLRQQKRNGLGATPPSKRTETVTTNR